MKQLNHSAIAIAAAAALLLVLTGVVQSSTPSAHAVKPPTRPDYAYTRIVTITVSSSAVSRTPGLASRWQFETIDQIISGTFQIPLPDDAYEISVALPI
ncbi:MAG TPA: hypothetical protein VMP08_00820, partial [Anaerolineae bacterium]|nr:hypothetical protein [Anaerolineae bacterium]